MGEIVTFTVIYLLFRIKLQLFNERNPVSLPSADSFTILDQTEDFIPRSTYRLLTLVLDKICMQSIILWRDHWHWQGYFFVYGSELSISYHTELLHFSFYLTFIECNFPLLRLSSHK